MCPTDEQTTQRLYATYPLDLDPPETVDEPDWEAEAETVGDDSNNDLNEAEDFFTRAASLEDAFQYHEDGNLSHYEGNVGGEEQLVRVAEDDDYHSSYYMLRAEQYNTLFSVVEVGEDENLLTNNVEYSGIRFGAASTQVPEEKGGTQSFLQYTLIRPTRTAEENRPLVILTKINGFLALTLVDSACTTDAVSPDFARVAGIGAEALDKEIPLQLGTAGS